MSFTVTCLILTSFLQGYQFFSSVLLEVLLLSLFVCFNIYLFILAVPGLSCGMQDLRCGVWASQLWHADSQLWHVGSSSLTRDRTWAPCIGSVESYPLDHQGSPCCSFLSKMLTLCLWYNLFPQLSFYFLVVLLCIKIYECICGDEHFFFTLDQLI